MQNDSRRPLLIDTNVLVYAVDPQGDARSAQATRVLREILTARRGVVSSQILTEFYDVTTRARGNGSLLTAAEASKWVEGFLNDCAFVEVTSSVVREAVRGARAFRMRIYDAQIWATAKWWELPYVLTEDMPGRRWLESVRYVNPFAPEFKLSDIGL